MSCEKNDLVYGRDSVKRKVSELRLWEGRLGTNDVSDQIVLFLRCPFNLTLIVKDGAHQSKI